jgi:hypothetical protein
MKRVPTTSRRARAVTIEAVSPGSAMSAATRPL